MDKNNDKDISDFADLFDDDPTNKSRILGEPDFLNAATDDWDPDTALSSPVPNAVHADALARRDATVAAVRAERHGRAKLQQVAPNSPTSPPDPGGRAMRSGAGTAVHESHTVLLRARIQDLETYINGRKSRWEALAAERKRLHADLALARQSIDLRNSRITGHARTTVRLQKRIEDQNKMLEVLRDRLTTDPGGSAPVESAQTANTTRVNVVLRAAHRKLTTMRDEQNRLRAELLEKNAYIDRLCRKISELELERTETVGALQKQRRVIERIESEIRSRLARVAMSNRKPSQARAISASIHRLDEQRAKLQAKIAHETKTLTGRLTLLGAGDRDGAEFVIAKRSVTIGRGADSDIQIRRDSISRRHARLECDTEGMVIHDLGSTNGVFVNDQRVRCGRLHHGDIINVGRIRLRFTDLLNDPTRHNAS